MHLSRLLRLSLLLALAFFLAFSSPLSAQTRVKKVVLQGFWWDYWNNNYPNRWADYLTELTPRLRELGIDGVWMPPNYKNGSTGSVGYSPFDHYDMGDKYQKGSTRTRVGNKDELLRFIAVAHANGIEVYQDIVLNHVDNAGSTTGAGGQDPLALSNHDDGTTQGFKVFRYSSYATPGTDESAADYQSRDGRWEKNWPNFYPNEFNPCCSNDINTILFGPDISYEDNAFGLADLTTPGHNPPQTNGHMRNGARDWLLWHKKQTAVDGYRWDAVKHFPTYVQQDLSFNAKYILPAWAQGGEAMFNVAEYVGGKSDLDTYVADINGQNGGSETLMGTFDFGLRGFGSGQGLYGAVYNFSGNYDLSLLPGEQQNVRYYDYAGQRVHRSVNFVNNHDTFRPQTDAAGNITGWNFSQELAAHIEPTEPRLSIAYAVAFTMDGNIQVFFEDLFDLTQSNRFSHEPTDPATLPIRDDIANLIWCHQNLDFKDGDYIVPFSDPDHLVLGRQGKALVGINDQFSSWQNHYVPNSSFAPGTVLKDYSGANGTATVTVDGSGGVWINTPPVDPTQNIAGRKGYSVWAPVGQDGDSYQPPRSVETTMEWEMADDLGDSHCLSLGYGGAIPDFSCNQRVAGKVMVASGTQVSVSLFPLDANQDLTVAMYDLQGNELSTVSGTGTLTDSWNATYTGWVTFKVRNSLDTQPGQRCFVQVTYTAPMDIDTDLYPEENQVAIWSGNGGSSDWTDCANWEEGKTPDASTDVIVRGCSGQMPQLNSTLQCRNFTLEAGASLSLDAGATLEVFGDWEQLGNFVPGNGNVRFAGSGQQRILSLSTFGDLEVDNAAGVVAQAAIVVNGSLVLTEGVLDLGSQTLTAAQVSGGSASSFVQTANQPNASGGLVRPLPGDGSVQLFPVGTNGSYTPVSLSHTGTAADFRVRVFAGVLENGDQGSTVADPACGVNRSWEIEPVGSVSGLNVDVTLQWNAAEEGATFDRSQSFLSKNPGGAGGSWTTLAVPAAATNPSPGVYRQTVSGVQTFSVFKCVSCGDEAFPVEWLAFSGSYREGGADLGWTTAREVNNRGFFVEKAEPGRDFAPLDFVAGAGDSEGPRSYAFRDPQLRGNALYRLRQVDFDGSFSYSETLAVQVPGPGARCFPNPSQAGFQLELWGLSPGGELRLSLHDAAGRLLADWRGAAPDLQARFAAQTAGLATGLYLLRVQQGSWQWQEKLIRE